ncbi:MAG: SAM-dependent DNA methyltransferase [Candidatus Altiarchaeota archaeon]|nr:SAM-dependent DNA methyltransferase [Candidatus Altiarchaeota archaeon]
MTKTNIPNWVENKYKSLWEAYKTKDFRMDDAEKTLLGSDVDKAHGAAVILSELRKAGWIVTKPDPKDARKTIYNLKSREEIIKSIFSVEVLSRSDIEGILKKAADLIRTRVDYKFILVLLFYKRISDKWDLEYETARDQAIKDGFTPNEAEKEAKNAAYHDFVIPEGFLWDDIRKDVTHLPEKFSEALKTLAEKNPQLKDVLDNMDFIQFTTNRENAEILRQLVELFSEKKLHHVSADILGDAYEWVLRYFAPEKAKEGEVYTPREVIKLLVEILDPKPKESVYDPASASNGMLIVSYKHVEESRGTKEADKLFLYGQEANHKTLAFGRMNMYIHDIKNAHLAYGDTLLYPKHKDGEGVKQFDVVIANPPWNQDGYDELVVKKADNWKKRYPYGFPPRQSADWVWIQHMITSANEDGRIGIVIDNGCLFRGGKEKAIRSKAVEENLIETVILLPEKLFYNTGAPGAIMILNKNKPKQRKGKIQFINASSQYEKHPDVRKLNILSDENIKKIVEIYRKHSDEEGFSHVADIGEIRKNDYNLNVTLYAYPVEKHEEIDIEKEWVELGEIEKEIKDIDEKIGRYLKEIK